MAQPSLEPRSPGFLKARQGAGAGRKARTRSHLGDWVHCGVKLLACKLHANRCKTACFMLICRVESYDIFGNRAAALVPGHCRTRVPFFFLSFIIMMGPINLGLAVIPPLLACKPGSCHPQGLPRLRRRRRGKQPKQHLHIPPLRRLLRSRGDGR